MLRISIVEQRNRRRLVLEGKLVAPWAHELKPAYEEAIVDLDGRELVIDVKNVVAIGKDGENVLLELMKAGARFRCAGVFTKHILKRLALEIRKNVREEKG
jgi:anti-anti-sigma regulatory factor